MKLKRVKYFIRLLLALAMAGLLLPQLVYAQMSDIAKRNMKEGSLSSSRIVTMKATKTIGTPYLFDKFIKGQVVLSNGAKTEDLYLRFNIEKNQLEFLRGDKILVANSSKIKSFKIYGEKKDLRFTSGFNIDVDDIDTNAFLRVAYDGDIKLLVFYKARLQEGLVTYGTATQKNKYYRYKKYYLSTEAGEFHVLEEPKHDISHILNKYEKEIKRYANSNNLNFNHEKDLIEILRFYDKISA